MTAEEIVLAVAAALERTAIPYMTVDGIAGIYYGINRTTDDADFLLQVRELNLTALRQALGPGFIIDAQISFETISLGTRYAVSHPESDFDIDLFLLRDDPHDQLAFSRRKRIAFDRGEAFICTPEDYIITKLLWAKRERRPKDFEDVRAVLAVQRTKLDLPFIRHWCDQHATHDLLKKALRSIPPIPDEPHATGR
jgi:hypothetical protein